MPLRCITNITYYIINLLEFIKTGTESEKKKLYFPSIFFMFMELYIKIYWVVKLWKCWTNFKFRRYAEKHSSLINSSSYSLRKNALPSPSCSPNLQVTLPSTRISYRRSSVHLFQLCELTFKRPWHLMLKNCMLKVWNNAERSCKKRSVTFLLVAANTWLLHNVEDLISCPAWTNNVRKLFRMIWKVFNIRKYKWTWLVSHFTSLLDIVL